MLGPSIPRFDCAFPPCGGLLNHILIEMAISNGAQNVCKRLQSTIAECLHSFRDVLFHDQISDLCSTRRVAKASGHPSPTTINWIVTVYHSDRLDTCTPDVWHCALRLPSRQVWPSLSSSTLHNMRAHAVPAIQAPLYYTPADPAPIHFH